MADIITSRIFTDGEKGITATKMNDIIGGASVHSAFYSAKPTASTADAADALLILKATGSYAQIPFSAVTTSVAGQLPSSDPEIWSVRLRSYNACGNPSFIVDQANGGAGLTNVPTGGRIVDRWFWYRTGSHTINSSNPGEQILLPGSSYMINDRSLTLTLGTQQTTLGAGDYGLIRQSLEGIQLRPLFKDVHSVSILIKSSIANLKFSYFLQDPSVAHSYTKLCSLGAANTWTLITIPNIPILPAGTWASTPGNLGGYEGLCFGAGTTFTASADGAWQAANVNTSPGTTNFFGSSVGATVSVAFIQHEPGSVCSTLMDKGFSLDEAQRYYAKSYDYEVLGGAQTFSGSIGGFMGINTNGCVGNAAFPVKMAKIPTVVLYNPNVAATQGMYNITNGTQVGGAAALIGQRGFSQSTAAGQYIVGNNYMFHFTADTGW